MKPNTKKASLKDQKSSSPSDSKRSTDALLASMGKREDEIPEVSGDMNTETTQGNE
jgi:hypothetical protein